MLNNVLFIKVILEYINIDLLLLLYLYKKLLFLIKGYPFKYSNIIINKTNILKYNIHISIYK